MAFPSLKRFLAPATNDDNLPDTAVGRLLNISTNGVVDSNGMIAGLIVAGGARRVVIMGERFDTSLDPIIQLTDRNNGQLLRENDDWRTDVDADEMVAKLRSPRYAKDAGFIITLQRGVYLGRLFGVGESAGRGIISVTEVSQ